MRKCPQGRLSLLVRKYNRFGYLLLWLQFNATVPLEMFSRKTNSEFWMLNLTAQGARGVS